MRYRDVLGQRLLAVTFLTPTLVFLYLGFASSAWWFIAAVSYPFSVFTLLWFRVPDENGSTADSEPPTSGRQDRASSSGSQ